MPKHGPKHDDQPSQSTCTWTTMANEGRMPAKIVGCMDVHAKARPVAMQQPVEIAAFSKGREKDAFDEEGRKNLVRDGLLTAKPETLECHGLGKWLEIERGKTNGVHE